MASNINKSYPNLFIQNHENWLIFYDKDFRFSETNTGLSHFTVRQWFQIYFISNSNSGNPGDTDNFKWKLFRTNLNKWDTDDGPYQSPARFPVSSPKFTSVWIENGLFLEELSPNQRMIFRCILSSCVTCICDSESQRQLRLRKCRISASANIIWPLRIIQPQPQSDV